MKIHFLSKQQAILFLRKSKKFQQYCNITHKKTFHIKFGNSKIKTVQDTFLNRVVDFPPHTKQKITKSISILPSSPLTNIKWVFICLKDNTEQNWPFTIQNSILCTSKFVNYLSTKQLSETMAHERIHNLQYLYPVPFHTLYESLGFIEHPINGLENIIYYSNPDGLQLPESSWLLHYKNNIYLPIMIFKNKQVKKKLYCLKKDNLNRLTLINKSRQYKCEQALQSIIPETAFSQCYHPHEMLADLGSYYIVRHTTKNNKIDNFFKNLEIYINDH